MKSALTPSLKKLLQIILLLFLPFGLSAQIKVIDSLTRLPLQGVTVSVDENAVQVTDEHGEFDSKTLKTSNKVVVFTSIGYQKRVVGVEKLLKLDSVFLNPVIYSLNEVSIKAKRYKYHLVGGSMTLLHGSNSYGSYWFEEAKFFPNEYNEGSKITAVQYYVMKKQSFQKKTKVDLSNAFGVGVYEASADGSPGKAILLDELIVIAKEHAEWFEVNLEQYNLPMPKYGFVVSFKIFPASFYGVKEQFTKNEDFVAPILGIKTIIRKSEDSWQRGMFGKGKWHRDTFSHFAIRARVAEAK